MRVVLKRVHKSFKQKGQQVQALHDINFSVEEGEFICVIGPSGCGKSTLISLIAGLEFPDSGQVFVDDKIVEGPSKDRLVVFQEAALFPWLTVLANVEFGLKIAGVNQTQRRDCALEAIKMVHLSRFVNSHPHELSGGMKQRAALARAIVMDPKILLMDEPFAALDAQTRQMLQEELQELWQKTKKTILFVTHNVREATFLSDRVFEITARPGTIKKEYLISIPRPRREQDPHLLAVQTTIMGSLKDEIEKVAKQELDIDYEISKTGVVTPVDRNLGSNI
ncbi:MAG: nitrate/sulfonate/bicarbonate ABC transporter ATP-binding protein [Candidatus Omnitrophica bacterium CG07_land_8_20_14_0_80_50_8]|nr:MAG: nitrate/sulfonate/bicarbonate ABC transporter ATP-binding protein [Candidatus Omnitrophica bacterium CG1_02_49_16]PIU40631.1 MAG: nitrate/sulfonate/bicarbonate ABC transporter ATP-binding protein [Candidatus Omnitrophica bacterium CG07_land_8_20_14_0_80_50_8]